MNASGRCGKKPPDPDRRRLLGRLGLLLPASLVGTPLRAEPVDNSDVEVRVRIEGTDIHVDAHFTVEASPKEVWAVLTDFDNMAKFVSNLAGSEILGRRGNVVQVRQRGRARFGPLNFAFESVRDLTLIPFERIESRQVKGTLARMEGLTLLMPLGSGTRVVYHADSVSNQDIPPIIGPALIKSETEEQFHEMQVEILRRRQAAGV